MEDLSKDSRMTSCRYGAVTVGVSAGGLNALTQLLGILDEDFIPAMVIVQHRYPFQGQDDFIYRHLNQACRLPVKEAEQNETVNPGVIYLAPPGYHLLIETEKSFSLSLDAKTNYSRPSIDVLFESAADAYREKLIGVILTGASRDGARGLRSIKAGRGTTIVQDPKTAEFPTMPLEALKKTRADYIISIKEIGQLLNRLGKAGFDRKNKEGV